MIPRPKKTPSLFARHRTAIIGAVIVVTLGGALYNFLSNDETPRKRVMDVISMKLVPPPPPPQEPPPPEPPKMVEEQKIEPPSEQPEDKPADAPPPGPLALDAEAGAGSDGFGLGSKIGGADYLGGGGGSRSRYYANAIGTEIQRAMERNPDLAGLNYSYDVRVTASETGAVEKVEVLRVNLIGGRISNDELMSRIRRTISGISRFAQGAPPAELQGFPILLRYRSRNGAG